MTDWRPDGLCASIEELTAHLAPGENVVGPGRHPEVAEGIDGLLATGLPSQYPAWPAGATTDGVTVDLVRRVGGNSVEVIGMAYIDFAGEVFPYRAVFRRADGVTVIEAFIGQADLRTGAPPRLKPGSLINVVRDDPEGPSEPELLAGHHRAPITWTPAASWIVRRR